MGPLFGTITLECCIGSQHKPRNKDIMHLWQPEDKWIFFRSWTLCNDMSRFSQCIRRVIYISKIPSWQRSSYIFSLCIRHTINGWVVITHSKVLRWAHHQNLVLPSAAALGGCLILVRLLSTGLTYHIKCHLDPTINLEILQNSSAILGTNGFSDTYILEVNSPSHGY
jgi:hypothetical protein